MISIEWIKQYTIFLRVIEYNNTNFILLVYLQKILKYKNPMCSICHVHKLNTHKYLTKHLKPNNITILLFLLIIEDIKINKLTKTIC